MTWSRYVVALLVALSLHAGQTTPTVPPIRARPTPQAAEPDLRPVAAARVEMLVPNGWEVRLIDSPTAHRRGLQASSNLADWTATKGRAQGLEAFWVDAADVGVPSDYYYLAAQGPASEKPRSRDCQPTTTRVLLNDRPRLDRRISSPGNYVATAAGTCEVRETRWASFVAAPGFGPVRDVGIPESGLYYVLVVVDDGPDAKELADRLLAGVSFGGAPVPEFLAAAGGSGML